MSVARLRRDGESVEAYRIAMGWDEPKCDGCGGSIAQHSKLLHCPVAWRVRGYNQFKTGAPGPWRYVDGSERPKVNNPECCDIEPLYLSTGSAG